MTAPVTVAAAIVVTVLAALAVLQLLVAAGQPWGHFVWGGQHRRLPRGLRVASTLSIPLYVLIALILIERALSLWYFDSRK